jgi:hypothetical protein
LQESSAQYSQWIGLRVTLSGYSVQCSELDVIALVRFSQFIDVDAPPCGNSFGLDSLRPFSGRRFISDQHNRASIN